MSNLRPIAMLLALVLLPTELLAQQPATITGRVTSETGAPISSASIFVQTLGIGTLTRADGTYTLVVPANRITAEQTVQVTAQIVGHRSQSQPVSLTPGGTATLNFQLATDVLQLEGVVATGIGQTTTRERLGVSISSVSAEEITRVTTPNVVTALAGKAAGVEINNSMGDPGAATSIRIRGVNTISGNGQPLFVVDGIAINNDEYVMPASVQYGEDSDLANAVSPNRAIDLNPNDIASIEILKGAAAAAIYGARAANGVVLITTKSGQPGQNRATLTTSYSFDRVNKAIPLQRTFGQGTGGVADETNLRSWGAPITGESYDHWGELFEDGHLLDTNLTLSGGNERTSYFLSVGYSDHDGVIVGGNDYFQKTMARLKGSHKFLDNLQVTGNFAYTESEGSFIQKGSNLSGLLLGGLRTPPSFNNRPYLTEEGFHRSYTSPAPAGPQDAGVFDNPFFVIFEEPSQAETGRAFGNIEVDYRPWEWLRLTYTLGNDYSNDLRTDVLPLGNYTYTPGYIGRGEFLNRQLTQSLIGTANRQLSDAIGAALTLGYSRESRRFHRFFVEGQDFIAPGIFTLDNTVTRTPDEYIYRIHSESYFSQAQLDLANQLFLTAAVRNDGFSTFGESQKRHWFPKFSAAWDISRTAGLSDAGNPLLSFVKLRTAWGQAGNEPPVYGTVFGFTADPVDSGWNDALRTTLGGFGGVYSDVNKAQPDLGPERTTEFEVGLDASFLRDRAGLGVTYYNARTKDAIFQVPLATSTGFTSQLQNAAEIRNRGLEVTLDLRPLQTRNLSWEINTNWATNDNLVLSLGDTARQFVFIPDPTGGGFIGISAAVGHPVGVFRSADWIRCGRDNLPERVVTACQGAPAGAVFLAEDGFPLIDPTIRVIGDPNPDWTAGVRNTLTLFNNFQISTLVDIKQGGDVWNGTKGALYSYGTHKDTEVRGLQTTFREFTGLPVTGPGANQVVTFGEGWFRGKGSGFNVSGPFVEDGSYVKLREVAFNYTVPTSLARRLSMGAIDLRLAGRNLKTWTDYTGIDPETNLTGTSPLRGQDYFNNPQTRSWIITVGLTR